MNVSRIAVLSLVTVATLLTAACARTPVPSEDSSLPADAFVSHVTGEYQIGVDDRVQVSVWRNPELSVTVPVRPDGKISVPLIGDVQAGGKTASEVARLIEQKLTTYVRDPHVAVILTDLRSHEFMSRVRVTGAVRTPRSMPYRQGMTVLDAVLEAGGINEFAAPNRTKLFRKGKDRTDSMDIDLGEILNKGRVETNATLRPGDVITIPERLF
jgi:polysaccharide export outer membrane protein